MPGDHLLSRIEAAMSRMFAALKTPRAQRIAWALAVIMFLGGFAASLASQPELISSFRLSGALIVLLVLCPVMTVVNMAATRETARLAGVELSFGAALRLAVMSAAANHLPIPGGPLLRTAVFQAAGGRLKNAGLANVAAGIGWMSATFLFAGAWTLLLDAFFAGALLGLGGVLFVLMIRVAPALPDKRACLRRLTFINFVAAAVYALSIHIALNAFGAAWSFPQAAVVASAGVIGAASSITPSGLGVREAAAAGLALLIGAEPAAGFAATAMVHLAMAAFTGGAALYFFLRGETAPMAA